MEVRATEGARVSLGMLASDLALASAERDNPVPHGRILEDASQCVPAPIEKEH